MADFVIITTLPQPQRHLVMSGVSFMYRIPLFFQEKTHVGESRVSAKIFNTYLEKHSAYPVQFFKVLGLWGMECSREKGRQMLRFFISESSNS